MSGSRLAVIDSVRLTSQSTTVTRNTPIEVAKVGNGSERLAEGRPILAVIERDRDGTTGALDGTAALWGANLHNPFSDQASAAAVQVFAGDGVNGGDTGHHLIALGMPYSAWANYNYIVKLADAIVDNSHLTFEDDGSGNTAFYFDAIPAKGARIEIHKVTPVAVVADGANAIKEAEVVGKKVVWAALTPAGGNVSRTLVVLRALN